MKFCHSWIYHNPDLAPKEVCDKKFPIIHYCYLPTTMLRCRILWQTNSGTISGFDCSNVGIVKGGKSWHFGSAVGHSDLSHFTHDAT
jgi:hypothetical protein